MALLDIVDYLAMGSKASTSVSYQVLATRSQTTSFGQKLPLTEEENEEIDGKAVLIEVLMVSKVYLTDVRGALQVLSAPFGKAAKNELRGAYKVIIWHHET